VQYSQPRREIELQVRIVPKIRKFKLGKMHGI
jgi:hypothetical protein